MATSKTLPAALARRARRAAKAGHERHEHRARELVAFVLDRKQEIAAAFWDIGHALAELKSAELHGALGYDTFEEAVVAETKISVSSAMKLVDLAARLPRSLALTIGQEKAAALLRLADARGEGDAAALAKKAIALPGRHTRVRPIDLGANELKRAARDEVVAHGHGRDVRARGLSDARDVATRTAKALATKGVATKIEARTTRDGRGVLRIDVPVDAIAIVARVLARV